MLAAPQHRHRPALEIMVAENSDNQTVISYNSTQCLAERHGAPDDLMKSPSVFESLAAATAQLSSPTSALQHSKSSSVL